MSYMNITQLQQRNALYIRTIQEGMAQYPFYILEGTEEMHLALLREVRKQNADEAYADFYYKRVDAKAQALLNQHLNNQQQAILETILQESRQAEPDEEYVILPLNEELLTILLHISYEELLFSTFYFTQLPCTIWSNYGGRFILFMKNEETCQSVLEMAEKIGLTLEI